MMLKTISLWLTLLLVLTGPAHAKPPIYDPAADPWADLSSTMKLSSADDKLILVAFGADWCPDCRVLSKLLKQPELKSTMEKRFHIMKVDVGEWDNHMDFVKAFGNPIAKGIPSIAIIDKDAQLHYVSNAGEFAAARSAKASELKQWFQAIEQQIKSKQHSPLGQIKLK